MVRSLPACEPDGVGVRRMAKAPETAFVVILITGLTSRMTSMFSLVETAEEP